MTQQNHSDYAAQLTHGKWLGRLACLWQTVPAAPLPALMLQFSGLVNILGVLPLT